MEGAYANKSHVHLPCKGKGSYDRNKETLDVTWEEDEAFRELERQQKERENKFPQLDELDKLFGEEE